MTKKYTVECFSPKFTIQRIGVVCYPETLFTASGIIAPDFETTPIGTVIDGGDGSLY